MGHRVLAFRDVLDDAQPVVGAKALSLARLKRAGLPVPPGFCVVGNAYRDHMRTHGLWAQAESIADGRLEGPVASALAALRSAIVDAPISGGLAADVAQWYRLLDGPDVAVRSSATAEDLPGHSFAGQHGTYFVCDLDGCLERLKHCWASLWSERAFEYRAHRGFKHLGVDMAVVVQSLVLGESSGVMFTADPVSGRGDRIVIEACFGLGEGLVSGKVTPDRIVMTKDDLDVLERVVSAKTTEVARDHTGEILQRELTRGRGSLPAIDVETAKRLAELALVVERRFGEPQDIEWTIAAGQPYLLQSRPITALPESIELPRPVESGRAAGPSAAAFEQDQLTSPATVTVPRAERKVSVAEEEHLVWSNVNTGEVLPDVASPLTWSITEALLDKIFASTLGLLAIDVTNEPLCRLIAGRAYFCVTTFIGIIRSLPGLADMDMRDIFGGADLTDDDGQTVEVPLADVPRRRLGAFGVVARVPLVIGVLTSHSPKNGLLATRRLRAEIQALQSKDIEGLPEHNLAPLLEELSDGEPAFGEMITYALVGMIYFSNLFSVSKKWLGDTDGSVASRLLAGMGGMDSAEAGLDLWRLAVAARQTPSVADVLATSDGWEATRERLRATPGAEPFLERWDAFMALHGHHTRSEIDVMNPRWSETPDYVMDVVRSYVSEMDRDGPKKADPVTMHRRRAEEREALTRDCRARLRDPVRRAVFDFLLVRAQRGCVVRENVKSEAIRLVSVMRRVVLELGRRLARRQVIEDASDVFFLRMDELEPVRVGAAGFDVKDTIARRRAEYERNLTLTPPPVVVGTYDPDRHRPVPVDLAVETFEGLAVSPGVVRGPARVILRAESDQHVLVGEILVAPFTDPGWTPYFIPAAGIVMDMGGLLSHGSIVAREYGIPAVVNVGPATKTIKTGQLIEVDGTQGRVRVLREGRTGAEGPG